MIKTSTIVILSVFSLNLFSQISITHNKETINNFDSTQTHISNEANASNVQVPNESGTILDSSSKYEISKGLYPTHERYLSTPIGSVEAISEFSSNLPILIIDTENGLAIQDEPKINAHLGIIYNGEGKRNNSNDPPTEYNGNIGIEIRGNSTSRQPKKPYLFETRDDKGNNLNVALLGMPAENDWILRASYFDHTFMRNSLANYMARLTGYWAARTKHVEVILNGEYQGIYLLMENIKRDKNRLDLAVLDSTDVSGEDITGGYIWEINGRDGIDYFGENRKIKYPDFDDINSVQLEYIKAFDDAFRSKMKLSSSIYSNPNTGYVQHIWVESFIYEALVQESMRNGDAYGWSGFYHKDKNELINAGPVWDFDQSAGNSSYPDNGVIEGWMLEHPKTNNTPFYWPLLFNDPYFKYSLSLRWKELRADKYKTNNLMVHIDSIASSLFEAQIREFEKWPVLGKDIYRETIGYEQRDTYQKEVDYLKEFLTKRWEWIDLQLANIQKPDGYPEINISNDISHRKFSLAEKKVYVDLNDYFSYPYFSKLKYKANSSDTTLILPSVKNSGQLKLELNGLGSCDIFVTATDTYGNKNNTDFTFEVVLEHVDVAETNKDNNGSRFYLFPNPASNNISLFLEGDINSYIYIEVYSYTGQIIERVYNGPNSGPIYYNCSNLENGVYFFRLITDRNKIYVQKCIVNR